MKKKTKIHYLFILDESGSMQAVHDETINSVNEQLAIIRKTAKKTKSQISTTIMGFDAGPEGTRYNYIMRDVPVSRLKNITKEQYKPSGYTPLYDAIFMGTTELMNYPACGGEKVLVNIFTDGQENSSKIHTISSVRARIEFLTAQGWVFSFMGTGTLDTVKAFSCQIGIHFSNTAAYSGNSEDYKNSMTCMNSATQNFIMRASAGLDTSKDFYGTSK